ncbi:hypothetical protein E2F46_12385 [Luteimonas aestuarii]|uniref:Uncharacterized protein n=1 Tax=Luteimonas aestuarii TaxID=453837 RepID=A0A4R5TT96_9GAMM|nr:hypothetical protein [Luteimonas aestuarii]TDK23152.1 hypothetical protein E2F46_12385 [Luteimonas aestuarii]
MWMREIALAALLCTPSACTSADRGSDAFVKLRGLDDASRNSTCLTLPDEEKIELFFEAQQRHHEYFGFDRCFASSSPAFLADLKSEIVKRGTVESVRHYIIVLAISQQKGNTSSDEIRAMELPKLCQSLANRRPSGNPSQCIEMAEDLLQ